MNLAKAAQILFIIAAAIGVFSFVRSAQNDATHLSCQALCSFRPTYAAMNRRVPDFELPDFEGNKVRFSSFLGGKPVVLNFWTKTCEPCLEEMPSLQEMAGILKKDGVKLVTICTDEGPDEVRDTLKVALGGQKPAFEILFDPDTEVVADMFGTTLYPETWIIDGDGIIRVRIDGKRDWSSALALEVIEMVGRPIGCPVEFGAGRLQSHGDLCNCVDTGKTCLGHAECCDPNASCIKSKCTIGKPPKRRKPPPRATTESAPTRTPPAPSTTAPSASAPPSATAAASGSARP